MTPEFLSKGQPKKFHKGDAIYSAEHLLEAYPIYFLLDGRVEVVRKYNPLKSDRFEVFPGQLFGLVEVYGGDSRETSAHALTDCQVVGLKKADFEEATAKYLNLALLSLKSLSGMLRMVNQRVKELED